MRVSRLSVDPLWECLCPSWKQSVSALPLLRRPAAPSSRTSCKTATTRQHRDFNTSTPHNRPRRSHVKRVGEDTASIGDLLKQSTLSSCYIKLNESAALGRFDDCHACARYLITERGEKPSALIYNALILVNTDTMRGSTWRVRELLAEMDKENIKPDVHTCHALLRVTAVHLDHFLRSDTLVYMKELWIDVRPEGHHDIVVGMLREGCLESALEYLDKMRDEGIRVESWLLDMFIYALCDGNEIDMAFKILRSRAGSGEQTISRTLWYYMLDVSSQARHVEATEYIWTHKIQTYILKQQKGLFHVGSGICLNILVTAAQAGNSAIATEVLEYMAARGEEPSPLHYEQLIASHMNSQQPNTRAALTVLSAMAERNMPPTIWQTRPIFQHIRSNAQTTNQALGILGELHREGRAISSAAVNLIMNCYMYQEDMESALSLYKQLHLFTADNPHTPTILADVDTFNMLFKTSRKQKYFKMDDVQFLIAEMQALNITPDELTFDRLISVFAEAAHVTGKRITGWEKRDERNTEAAERIAGYLDYGMQYFHSAANVSWAIRAGTIEALAKALAYSADERCWEVLQYADERLRSNDRWALKASSVRSYITALMERREKGWINPSDLESEDAEPVFQSAYQPVSRRPRLVTTVQEDIAAAM